MLTAPLLRSVHHCTDVPTSVVPLASDNDTMSLVFEAASFKRFVLASNTAQFQTIRLLAAITHTATATHLVVSGC